MKLVMKEGWLVLDMIYITGREKWEFFPHKPDYVEGAWNCKTEAYELSQVKRIFYIEADNVEVAADE